MAKSKVVKKAYEGTKISYVKSQEEIIKLLKKNNISQTRFTNFDNGFAIEFVWEHPVTKKPIGFKLLIHTTKGLTEDRAEQEIRRLYRVLFYHLKSKFVAIEAGLTEMLEEFLPYVVMISNTGTSTAGELFIPKFEEKLLSGEQLSYRLLEGK